MSDQLVIEHCSPTLAGIKTGNMFSVKIDKDTDVTEEIRQLNMVLRRKGLRVIPLKVTACLALIYIYRPGLLKRDLSNPKAVSILRRKGYDCGEIAYYIAQLTRRMATEDTFPHEIGLFLGYPPEDVEGFMRDSRNGVKCSGCWKAYSNVEEAKRTFVKYRKCTDTFCKLNRKGKTLGQLAVSMNNYVA